MTKGFLLYFILFNFINEILLQQNLTIINNNNKLSKCMLSKLAQRVAFLHAEDKAKVMLCSKPACIATCVPEWRSAV